jgi:hypothetical protein
MPPWGLVDRLRQCALSTGPLIRVGAFGGHLSADLPPKLTSPL